MLSIVKRGCSICDVLLTSRAPRCFVDYVCLGCRMLGKAGGLPYSLRLP